MKSIVVLLVLTISASVAMAKKTGFECRSVNESEQIRVFLDLDRGGNTGRIEVQYMDGFPPLVLVSQNFVVESNGGGFAQVVSDVEIDFNYQAKMQVPAEFASLQEFAATVTVTRDSGKPISSRVGCQLNR